MRKEVFSFEPLTQGSIKQTVRLRADGIFSGHQNLGKGDLVMAKEFGLKVYVEIGLFVGKEWWKKYPDSRPINSYGRPLEPEDWYFGVCPNHPEIRRLQLSRIEEVIKNSPLDGLWLDFIRYPGHWEVPKPHIPDTCYCPNCLQRFSEVSGASLPKDFEQAMKFIKSNPIMWQEFREAQITEFVAQVRKIIDSSGKSIELGIFLMPDEERAKAVAQNFSEMAKYVDTLSPMLYHAMCGQSVEWLGGQVNWAAGFGKPVLPIIQTEDKPRALPADEFQEALEIAAKPPSKGVIILFLEDVLKNPRKTEVFEKFRIAP